LCAKDRSESSRLTLSQFRSRNRVNQIPLFSSARQFARGWPFVETNASSYPGISPTFIGKKLSPAINKLHSSHERISRETRKSLANVLSIIHPVRQVNALLRLICRERNARVSILKCVTAAEIRAVRASRTRVHG